MNILPYVVAFSAMVGYAALTPIAKKLAELGLSGVPLILINSIFLATFSLLAIPFLAPDFSLKTINTNTWLLAGGWAFINFVAFALYLWAVARMPATEYQIMYLASPIIVALIAYALLSEPLHLKHFIGGVVVAIGVYIAIR